MWLKMPPVFMPFATHDIILKIYPGDYHDGNTKTKPLHSLKCLKIRLQLPWNSYKSTVIFVNSDKCSGNATIQFPTDLQNEWPSFTFPFDLHNTGIISEYKRMSLPQVCINLGWKSSLVELSSITRKKTIIPSSLGCEIAVESPLAHQCHNHW